jgi:ethanolamine ammonia-lyase large subunit
MENKRLLEILSAANEFKEGDASVGGVRDETARFLARQELECLRVGEINAAVLVEDGVSETLLEYFAAGTAKEILRLSLLEVKNILLGTECARFVKNYRRGLKSETIAAVVKIMTNAELGVVARSIYNPLPGKGIAIGSPHHFGSRIQPNSAGDNEEEILFSIFEGLSYGCGDVVIGLNPACDDVETVMRLENLLADVVKQLCLPTRWCVLSDIIKQTRARERGAKVDVGFQSIAGTSKALAGYVGLGIKEILELARGFDGLYFETGQGSEVTNGAAEGVDMVTLESRCYGVARYLEQKTGKWTIVNDVAGFIGPEVFRTEEQLFRACLEDTVMAKLHGLTFGLDVCATFHMGIAPNRLRAVTEKIVQEAAPAYLMSVAGNADPMLGYLTTSPREHARLRFRQNRSATSLMQDRLAKLGVPERNLPIAARQTVAALYAKYQKTRNNRKSFAELTTEANKKINALQERNFDIGFGCPVRPIIPPEMEKRIASIYENAQDALTAKLETAVLRDTSSRYLKVNTLSFSRDEYITHPASGEFLRGASGSFVRGLYESRRPEIQMVLSDGLNANALNENLRTVLPGVRQGLTEAGFHVGDTDIFITNGRVRAGYDVGSILEVPIVIHFIGERPGTGLDTLSIYITYGKDPYGQSRFRSDMNHSCTTVVCGIHKRGKHPDVAVDEIINIVKLIFEKKCSGTDLYSRAPHSKK